MTHTRKRHRHAVVLPLMIGIAVLTSTLEAMTASVVSFEEAESSSILRYDSGQQVLPLHAAVVSRGVSVPRLKAGAVLVHGEGVTHLRAREVLVSGLAGGFYASLNGSKLSVAALTSPVSVYTSDERVLIPTGMQWSFNGDVLADFEAGIEAWVADRSLSYAPKRFTDRYVRQLARLVPHDNVLLAHDASPTLLVPDALLLDKARQDRRKDRVHALLTALKQAVASGDGDEVLRLLTGDPAVESLGSSADIAAMAVLAGRAPAGSDVRRLLLSWLSLDGDVWLLAGIHPMHSAVAWALIEPDLTVEQRALATITLPASDMNSQAHNHVVLRRWRTLAESVLNDDVSSADAFADVLTDRTLDAVDFMIAREYPLRAREYVRVLRELSVSHRSHFSQEALSRLSAYDNLDDVTITDIDIGKYVAVEEEAARDEPDTEDVPVEESDAMTPEEVERIARDSLRRSGALFTVDTAVVAVDGTTAHVRSVVYGGTSGDRMFDFKIDVGTEYVRDIKQGAETYPYALDFEKFVRWARS